MCEMSRQLERIHRLTRRKIELVHFYLQSKSSHSIFIQFLASDSREKY